MFAEIIVEILEVRFGPWFSSAQMLLNFLILAVAFITMKSI